MQATQIIQHSKADLDVMVELIHVEQHNPKRLFPSPRSGCCVCTYFGFQVVFCFKHGVGQESLYSWLAPDRPERILKL